MYKFARLRALLWSLSVSPSSQRSAFARRAFVSLGTAAVTICFALALIFRTPRDWPVTWHDIAARDDHVRSLLLSSFVSLLSGLYFVSALWFGYRAASARLRPLPELAPALRDALRARDPRIVKVEQVERPEQERGADGANSPPISTLTIPSPEPLTRSLWLVLVTFASGMLALTFTVFLLWTGLLSFDEPVDSGAGARPIFTMLRLVGIVAPLALVAFGSAWRLWIRWLARVRGAQVELSAEGLTIRDQVTLWRRRFIPWRDVASLARFTYNDSYVRPRTVYLLDSGDQTFLWESPADMRYAAPAARARITERQAKAAQLLAHVSETTKLPLLNITGVVSAVTKIDPEPRSASNQPDPRDTALLDFILGRASRDSVEVTPPRL